MLVKGLVDGLKLDPVNETMGQCESCENAKATCKPISKVCKPQCCEHFGNEVHTDVWGPAQVQTPGHNTYYVSFTDDYTHYTHITLLGVKSDTFNAYKAHETWAKTQHRANIKCL
jgi:hypothetical protein